MGTEQSHAVATSASPPHTDPAVEIAAPQGAARPRWRLALWTGAALAVTACAAGGYFALFHNADKEPRPKAAVIPVNTVFPTRTTLVRSLEQPGSVLPYAQAELYAKTSGYIRLLRRDMTPEIVAALLAQRALCGGPAGAPLLGQLGSSAGLVAAALWRAPPVDIGSTVSAGDLLIDIDVPERRQDVFERTAVAKQREEEVAQAVTVIAAYQASVEVAKAHRAQAEADVKRYSSEHAFRMKEVARYRDLVKKGALEGRLLDEKESQADAARSAWDSSLAKVQAAQADLTLANAKLGTARADVRVKQALLLVARTDIDRARIVEDYGQLHAPFTGTITMRGVDEGDFVQNSRTGQSRHLMTITATDKVKVGLKVPSSEGVLVRVGAEAYLTVDSRPGERFDGRVSRTRGALDLQSRTLEVEIDLDNRDRRLMPGMYGHVILTLLTRPNTYVIPAAALFSRKKVNYVIAVRDGVARRQPVRILFDSGGQVEVVKLIDGREVPLDGGDELVVSGKGEIADGQRVQAIRSGK